VLKLAALSAKLESPHSEAGFGSSFRRWGDTAGLQPLRASVDTSAVQAAAVPAPLRLEKRSEEHGPTSLGTAPLRVLDYTVVERQAGGSSFENPHPEAIFGGALPWWVRLLLANFCHDCRDLDLLLACWSAPSRGRRSLTQLEEVSRSSRLATGGCGMTSFS